MRYIYLTLIFIFFVCISNAQPVPPNCPPSYSAGFNITGDSVSVCQDGVNLTVTGYSTIFNTSSYSVNSIPYAPYPWVGANTIINNVDDCWSAPVQLPFAFCYFGQKYTQVVIGANGQVSFDAVGTQPPLVGGTNPWSTNGQTAPNTGLGYTNCIMAPYHDINPQVAYPGKNISWDIYGTYPCRYMVISWDSIPMFSCSDSLASQQVVLFESTYLIDINIKHKPICSSWNGGVAHQGIENATGTTAFMVAGRNGTQWSASNDSYRFTPNGAISGNFTYYWIDVPTGDTLGTGSTLSYFPTTSSQVTVLCSVVTDCDTITAFNGDTINVLVTGLVTADFDAILKPGCTDDTVQLINNSVSGVSNNPQCVWTFSDGSISNLFNPGSHVYTNQGTYVIKLVVSDNGCADSIQKVVNFNHPIDAQYLAFGKPSFLPNKTCLGDSIQTDASLSVPVGGFLQYQWYWGDGTSTNGFNFPISSHAYADAGNFNCKLVVTDTLGCKDSTTSQIFVEAPGYHDFTVSDNNICIGQPVYFTDTIAPHAVSFTWDFGDNVILSNVHNPQHVYPMPGLYSVKLSSSYVVCTVPDVVKQIVVENYPSVNLGNDTAICPGVTGSIVLSNQSFGGGNLLWSTGETSNSILVNTPGYYWLQVTSPSGECSSSDSLWVMQDCYINIPNSFSPNNDGMNDYFIPRDVLSSGLKTFQMSIYNRWGERIYFTNKLDGRGWDGKYNDKMQEMGVYVYLIDVVFDNGIRKSFQGNVTLIK